MVRLFKSATDRTAVEWMLRVGVFGEFLGHGILGLQGKEKWVEWMGQLFGASPETGLQLVVAIGVLDVVIAVLALVAPVRITLLWAAFWGFATALVRPIVGESFWDFVERWANWAAPLSLLLLRGWPKQWKDWVK